MLFGAASATSTIAQPLAMNYRTPSSSPLDVTYTLGAHVRGMPMICCHDSQVLWAALFSLAVLVREGGEPFEPACRAALKAQLHKVQPLKLSEHNILITRRNELLR
jgi:hypothetical protein